MLEFLQLNCSENCKAGSETAKKLPSLPPPTRHASRLFFLPFHLELSPEAKPFPSILTATTFYCAIFNPSCGKLERLEAKRASERTSKKRGRSRSRVESYPFFIIPLIHIRSFSIALTRRCPAEANAFEIPARVLFIYFQQSFLSREASA